MSTSINADLVFINSLTEKNRGLGLGFSKRDILIKQEEIEESIEYQIIQNDKSPQTMRFLIAIKNLFAKQLPKMPKEYIVRLLFDQEHKCMVILKNKEEIIGGVCYKLFKSQEFAEIVFLAISNSQQIQGYGTRLMNRYKEIMQEIGIKMLLTYADNSAIGYFKKQGFSTEIQFEQDKWKGRIKDYDGGTMMECKIFDNIDYSQITMLIQLQKEFVIDTIKTLCINSRVFPGRVNNDKIGSAKDIPGIQNYEIDSIDEEKYETNTTKSYMIRCENILQLLKNNKLSWPFLEPVDKIILDYHNIIKDPIDLRTIGEKLKLNFYENDKAKFVNDIRKIFANAKIYNQKETIYYNVAEELSNFIEPYITEFLERK